MSSGGEETGDKGFQEVVLTGWGGCEGDTYGGLGGGTDREGGRRRTGRRLRQNKSVGGQCSKHNLRDIA